MISSSGLIAARVERNFFSSVQTIVVEQILKILLIQPKDIAKECVKIALPTIISFNNQFIKNYAIEYGCEAVWAGYYDGIDAIPGALIKYACIDICYHELCKVASFYDIKYPSAIKKHALLHSAARVLAPMFIKRCIATIIDNILKQFFECDQDDDQLLEMA